MRTVADRGVSEPARQPAEPLSWVLVRDGQALSCGVFAHSSGTFSVHLVPLWDCDLAIVETFDDVSDAFERQVEIAQYLRECGWLIAQRLALPTAV